jgi:hypothetical protein
VAKSFFLVRREKENALESKAEKKKIGIKNDPGLMKPGIVCIQNPHGGSPVMGGLVES